MTLKIAILSTKKKLYSTHRLFEAAKNRGHEVRVINPLRCYMNMTSAELTIHYNGKELPDFDAIIPRIGTTHTFYGAALVRQFEMKGVYALNGSQAIVRARDKLRSLQILSRKGVGLPITGFAHAPGDINDLIKMVGGAPLVIKILEGTQGIGVVMAETTKAAESVIEAFLGMKANILVQEYIKESNGQDLRCFVVGKKVVASMLREAKPGEFRANIHRGGKPKVVKITSEERQIAIRAAEIVGLRVAGVDILRSERGPLVIEVNSSPGLEGIEMATQKDVATMIIKYIEENAKKKQSERSQQE